MSYLQRGRRGGGAGAAATHPLLKNESLGAQASNSLLASFSANLEMVCSFASGFVSITSCGSRSSALGISDDGRLLE